MRRTAAACAAFLAVTTAVATGVPSTAQAASGKSTVRIHVDHHSSPIHLADISPGVPFYAPVVTLSARVTGCTPGETLDVGVEATQEGHALDTAYISIGATEFSCPEAGAVSPAFNVTAHSADRPLHPGKLRVTWQVLKAGHDALTKTSQVRVPDQPVSKRRLELQISHRTSPIVIRDVNFFGDQPDLEPATTATATASGCTPGSDVFIWGEAVQDGHLLGNWAGTHPGYGLTQCGSDGVASIGEEVFGSDLHPGRLRLTFHAYESSPDGPGTLEVTRSSQAKVPA
ncbi:hypothetical protein CLV35_3118 [Motilibacter peucedani]|uniref:Uncharacterized protein n=1 Tax=Motilibacter peucedani TaxID=598650 RepID=A0A420XLF8_9ACTN|nr:hypothetical protein [Motilibacter peucedani]RKS71322.1 hypothetical protein CLV35_3118 [Motilibacter peucedani]